MATRDPDVIILGGGVIGLACAHYLLEAGRAVHILEMERLGGGCSSGNCGLITPSHAAPLNAPGMIGTAFRSLADSQAPLHVKPTLRGSTLGWLLRFASKCNARAMRRSMSARAALLNSSRQLYDALIRDNALDCDWETRGVLAVYRSERGMRATEATEAALREFGVSSQDHVGPALLDLEPALRDDLYGGRLYTMDAQVRPERLVAALGRLAHERGATIEEDCHVRSFETGRAGVAGVTTSKGTFRAAHYVLATGAHTRILARRLGLPVHIEPGKGYSVTLDSRAGGPTHACILHERSVGVTPWAGGYRLGGTMEFAGMDTSLDRTRVGAIVSGAADYLRDAPTDLEAAQVWAGLRPMTPDELPYIGPAPHHSNLVVAAGHGMMGVSMAPATGLLVAETITGKAPHVDVTPYRVDRS